MFEHDLDQTKNNTIFSCSEFMNREEHEYTCHYDGRSWLIPRPQTYFTLEAICK